jgi:DNA invertase Pin-like site-specific DNA recombinase
MNAPRKEVRELFAKGWTAEELAKHFNVSVSTIYRRLRSPEISTVAYRNMKDGKPGERKVASRLIVKSPKR